MPTEYEGDSKLYIEIPNTKRKWWQFWKPKKVITELVYSEVSVFENL